MADRTVATVWRAAITAALPGAWEAFDYDDVPATLPSIYVEVTATRRFGGEQRGGTQTVTGWRLTARAVGTTVDECRAAVEAVASLEGDLLTLTGFTTSPLQFETAQPPEYDDGRYSALSAWTFVAWPTT